MTDNLTTTPAAAAPVEAPEGWYVEIERDNTDTPLAVGPYPSEKVAVSAMEYALLIDSFCQEDCLDAFVVYCSDLSEDAELAIIDSDNPDHHGPVR